MNPLDLTEPTEGGLMGDPAYEEIFQNHGLIMSVKNDWEHYYNAMRDVFRLGECKLPKALHEFMNDILFAVYLANQGATHLEIRGAWNECFHAISSSLTGGLCCHLNPDSTPIIKGAYGSCYSAILNTLKQIRNL